ncbi:MAG TPA: ABC transporter ATP-binding protein [Clostridiales bacterium]|nr:ABC transporter ATP-binding protein [Clostridiales bacterium]
MIKRLARCIREYKRYALITPVLVLLEVAMDILLPILMAVLIDDGIQAGNPQMIAKLSFALLGCTVVALLMGVWSGHTAAIASAGFAKNVRHDLFHNLQTFAFENIDRFSTSSLITRMTTDVDNLQHAFQMIIRITVRAPFMLIFSLLMAFRIHRGLSLVFLAVLPILGLSMYLVMSRVHPIFETVFKMYDKLNTVVQENLRGIRVVKSYVREEHEIQKFKSTSQDIYVTFSKAQKLVSYIPPVMQLCMFGCSLLLSWMGGRFIVFGEMTTGTLVSLLSYSMQILISLMILGMVFMMLVISRASAERVVEVLEEQTGLHSPENPVTNIRDGSIRFENVGFSYSHDKEKLALRNVNLTIQSGETVGILGGTGSAKTTLVQLIPRLYDVTEGRVLVGGVDVRDYDLTALRQEVAMVLQKNELFSGTIKENLRWGNPDATDEELEHACRLACAHEFIESFPDGYDTHIEQGGTNVSGGQKQRLCIARALLKKPKILILDDSTSAVDTKTDARIRQAFAQEIPNTTKLIITQRAAAVEHADKIVVLDEGEIVDVGTHSQLMERCDIYREVYLSQQKGGAADEAV